MVPDLIIRLLLALAALYLLYKLSVYLRALPPHKRRKTALQLLGMGLIGAVVVLTLTGRLHWLGAAIALLLPALKVLGNLLWRLLPLLRHWGPLLRTQPSVFTTPSLRFTIDFKHGVMEGDILAGEFSGRQLSQLSDAEWERFGSYCQQRDPEAQSLLQLFRQRHAGTSGAATAAGSGQLSRAEALAILGLQEGASNDEVIAAHRRLIQKVHPDRGGSDYLAARINTAKDTLLG